MTVLKERFSNFGVDDEGDVVPLEDFEDIPVANESIVQGMTNLENWNREQALVEEAETEARHMREQAVAEHALQNAGVYVTLEQHRRNQLELADLVSDMSMYKGGEKGGYKAQDFQERYKGKTADVESGARSNHRKIIHHDLPRIYKAKELKAAGFDAQEVDYDAKTRMRLELMERYGGPKNKKARDAWRKNYQ